jgi:site-specific DNA-methyltransferase (cytosine-N4-specific)
MPESVRDRPVAGCEYVLMLARGPTTYYDADAVRRPRRDDRPRRLSGQRRERVLGRNAASTTLGHPGQETDPHPAGRLWRASDTFFDSLSWAQALDYEGLVLGEDGEPLALITAIHPSDTGHAAPFPAELVEPLVRVSSAQGDAVLDPFLGSGTTAMVAQRLGRRWWGCEIYAHDAERAAARIRAKSSQLVIGGAA